MKYLKAIWEFCSFVFVPQRRPKDDSAARLCGERSNVPRDSAVLYGAGMDVNDTYL